MKDYFRTIKMAVGYNGKPLMEQIEIGLSKGEILTLIGPTVPANRPFLKALQGSWRCLAVRLCWEAVIWKKCPYPGEHRRWPYC